jgi:lambda family phage portal protein
LQIRKKREGLEIKGFVSILGPMRSPGPLQRRLSWRERLTGRTADLAGLGRPHARSDFLRGLQSPFFFNWQPTLRDPFHSHQQAAYEVGRRAIDAVENSGFLAGGVEQATTLIVGPELALNARPDPACFNDDAKAAGEWSRMIERRFAAWARSPYECDLAEKMTLSQMCSRAVREWFGYGEILGVVHYELKAGQEFGTKMQLLPPTRLPLTARNPDATQGVILDRNGAPLRYCIANFDPRPARVPTRMDEEVEVDARDEVGRSVVAHIHDSPPTVVRGMTPLAPALLTVRQFDQLANATLSAALVQAIFAATIESDMPNTDRVLEALQDKDAEPDAPATGNALDTFMDAKAEWYKKTNIDLGQHGKLVHLFLGEKLNFLRSEHPNENYKPFAKMLLLEISKCLGISYEDFTGDREGATYSSERMGSSVNWPLMVYRRKHIAARFMQCAYESWLDELVELEPDIFPGGPAAFLAQRSKATAADWRGPPKPSADEDKTAKANDTKLKNKIITREMWCADEGVDWEDVLEQLAREDERAAELGVDLAPQPPTGFGPGGSQPAQPDDLKEDTEPPGGEPEKQDAGSQ